MTIYCYVKKQYTGCEKEFHCMIDTISVVIRQSIMFETKKIFVCAQTIYCFNDTIYCFLITYLLLDTINFARSGICLSEVALKELQIVSHK